jgi:aryl-alcohol dehydrogenase-like predicted oxidoreductase
MDYVDVGRSAMRISRLVLGGHEYLPDGRSRGFNERFADAVTPGCILPGFGGEGRRAVLRCAYDLGINAFDVTMDSEKEALGRCLAEMPPPYEVFVQTRPEGMVYGYDPGNRKMADPALLRAEVLRILALLRRERVDLLNLGILRDAVDGDPEFLAKLAHNVAALKREGLVGVACADTFSGEATYLAQIASGAFDVLNVNFNVADDGARHAVLPAAKAAGLAVIVREVFVKGDWFRLGREAGIADDAALARVALGWALAQRDVDAVIVGAGTPAELRAAEAVRTAPGPTADDAALLSRIAGSEGFRTLAAARREAFRAAPVA